MAAVFADDLALVDGCEVVAVGSRSTDSAQRFIDAHEDAGPDARAHGSYQALADDPEVDAIYIASPHPQHASVALQAIEAGRAVLVEKAFTASLESTERVVAAARERGVFAMEAMWTRFQPVVRRLRELVDAGELGELVGVQGDLFAFREFDASDRLFAPELGGGAILDLGVYVVSFAQMLLGDAREVLVRGQMYPNGVEASASFLLTHDGGATSSLACGLNAPGPGRMVVVGTKGWAEVHSRFHHPTKLTVHRHGQDAETFEKAPLGRGYTHEIQEVNRCLSAGLTESPAMPLDDTLAVMRVLQAGLDHFGIDHRPHES